MMCTRWPRCGGPDAQPAAGPQPVHLPRAGVGRIPATAAPVTRRAHSIRAGLDLSGKGAVTA